jgi:O-antigen ligase
VSSRFLNEVPRVLRARLSRALGFLVVLAFLLVNLVAHAHALHASGPATWSVFLAVAALVAILCLVRPGRLGPALLLFGASFFLYGFHSYRPQSQAFELATTALALVLVLRRWRGPVTPLPTGMRLVLPFCTLYALVATFSLLLLPPSVLEHRLFLEGRDFARALLTAFPKDPLYPIASVARLWLFLIFAVSLSLQTDARVLYRWLFRGLAWAVVLAVVLGLLDFVGVFSLARYNLSHVFYGAQYRRLQSTFGNPSWFACFAACALPFVLLEWSEARRSLHVLLTAAFPLVAASLFLAAARAAWLALGVLLVALAGLRLAGRRLRRPLFEPGRLAWVALAASIATFALLAAGAYWPDATARLRTGDGSPGRLEGLSREVQIRGLGLSSPRQVAATYALELAKQKPLLGLGYESFNMHLRAQLDLRGSGVARVVNTAVASDPAETVFDDTHDTYLQVLTGTGLLGLALWLAVGGSAVGVVALALVRTPERATVAVALGMLVFHFYGLFQGMAYLPVTFFLFFAEAGYAMTLEPGRLPESMTRLRRALLVALALLVLASLPGYSADRGYRSLKRALGTEAYLPDEAAEFEGFYRPETGPEGEFRWMARRGIVNFRKAAPFRLSFTCAHPDLEREPVVVSLRFDDRDAGCSSAGSLVRSRSGSNQGHPAPCG